MPHLNTLKHKSCNSNQKWNKELCQCECKNPIKYHVCEKDYVSNPSTRACEIDIYSKIIIGDFVVMWWNCTSDKNYSNKNYFNKKLFQQIFMKKNVACKIENFNMLLTFLLITISLLMIISIHCFLIKYSLKQKYLLPYQNTIN